MNKDKRIKPDNFIFYPNFLKSLIQANSEGFFKKWLRCFSRKELYLGSGGSMSVVSTRFFSSRYIMIGDNPVLSALGLLYAARKNIEVLYCPLVLQEKDAWGYDCFADENLRKEVEKEVGFSPKEYIKSDWGLGIEDDSAVLTDWIEQFFGWVKSEISKTGCNKIYRLYEGFAYKLYGKEKYFNKNWFFVSPYSDKKKIEKTGIDKLFTDMFYLKIVRDLFVVNFKADNKSKIYSVFANKALVTSMVPDLSANKMVDNEKGYFNFTYDDRCIIPVGTAHKMVKDNGLTHAQIMTDISRIKNIIM